MPAQHRPQLAVSEGPPRRQAKQPDNAPYLRANLLLQLSSFIGRECELSGVTCSLDVTRLLTLLGVGGCGKTRLLIISI